MGNGLSSHKGARHEPGAFEHMKELDAEHRRALRGALPLTLSLRYIATALGRLRAGTELVPALPVARPPPGTASLTFVGHATVMITTARTRLFTDPLFERSFYGLRRAKEAGIHAADVDDADLVVISHAHRDHLSPPSLRRVLKDVPVVVPPRCGALLARLGFIVIEELPPGGVVTHGDVEITAVPVRHSGAGGFGGSHRGACGYIIRAQGTCFYFAGDTGYFSGFAEIGHRFHPDVAILPIGGYEPAAFRDEHLSPLDAVHAFDDLGARVLVPICHGSFPLSYEPLEAPTAWLRRLARERRLPLGAKAGPGEDVRRVALLDHGETIHLRRAPT
ncbi:MAG TPA: MBL fold metallo-hydrolase [Polyangia bacterium]|nr:MBL fold metallo-hydrolase [Polyangia bacterium]